MIGQTKHAGLYVNAVILRMAEMIRDHVESKRDALGINEAKERKLFDMADRRELKV